MGPVVLHSTADGGTTWQRTYLPTGTAPVSGQLLVGNPALAADGRALVPVFTFGPRSMATALYTSTDGGQTWLGPLRPPLPVAVGFGFPPDVAVTAAGGGWWAVHGERLALSGDAGRAWAQQPIDLPHWAQQAMAQSA